MTDNTPSLDDYLSGEPEDLTPDADLDRVNRVLHRLGTLQKRMDANSALAEAQIRKTREWETEVNSPLQEQAAYLHKELTFYALKYRETHPKTATINLPAGKLATRQANSKVEIADDKAFLRWAMAQAKVDPEVRDTFKVETKPLLPAIKKLMSADGDTLEFVDRLGTIHKVPGTAVTPPENAYTVTVTPNV